MIEVNYMNISVVIPLYNKEKHIKHTIETVLAQTYSDFELLIVDDGSTDNSAEIVSRVEDPRVRLIRKKNEGVSVTRNKGVALAQSELIAFLDADDEWDCEYLQKIADLKVHYPNAAIYATNYNIVERNGAKYCLDYPEIPEKGNLGLINNYFASAIQYTPLWTSAVCVKKNIFEDMGGFPVTIKNGEDLDLWCRIALTYPIAYCNQPLATYRRDSDNMLSRSITDPSWFPFLEDYEKKESHLIQDSDSVERYIIQRQLEAASSSLFILRSKQKCKKVMSGVRYYKWNKKKYYGLCVLQQLPQSVIDALYRVRKKKIKVFE